MSVTHFNTSSYRFLLDFLAEKKCQNIFVLVDENTKKYCLPYFEKQTKLSYTLLEIPSGENNKNIETVLSLWEKLMLHHADRHSVMIHLGGGVLSDMGGFVALTYKRGISYVNIPTTLLAMVDAAIGGKTGIDFKGLKNQIGVISPPEMTLVDPYYLATLPEREFISGLAECYKYGLISSPQLWENLKKSNGKKDIQVIIEASVNIKNDIVRQDPLEKGLRKVLNFGHTMGHAIETHFLELSKENQLLHGESIAIGMIIAGYLSHIKLDLPLAIVNEISETLLQVYPKIDLKSQDLIQIYEHLKHDKKNQNGLLNFVLLTSIGNPKWDVACSLDEIQKAVRYYHSLEI